MEVQTLQNLLFGLLLSGVLWWMIGIDKDIDEHSSIPKTRWKKDLDYNFWSVRSFALISIFWAMMLYIDVILHSWFLFQVLGFVIISVFVGIHYINSVFKNKDISPATEFVAILTYFIGILVYQWLIQFAIILAIILTFLLSSKDTLEGLGKYISKDELRTTLKFWTIAFVVLPLLPDTRFSVSQIFEFLSSGKISPDHPMLNFAFFNPNSIWFFVVVMSGVSYLWYILTKFVWKNSSIILSSILWGMVSSTATTASMTQKSKEDPANINSYVIGTLLASCIMFARVFLIVLFFSGALFAEIAFPGFVMFGVFLATTLYFFIQTKKDPKKKTISIESNMRSPFQIAPALQFAWLIVIIKYISGLWIVYKDIWWEWLFYSALGIISGFADVDAVTQTMSVDSGRGLITFWVAASTILLAVMSNNMVKGSIAWRFWNKEFGKKVMLSFLASIVAWLLVIWLRALS